MKAIIFTGVPIIGPFRIPIETNIAYTGSITWMRAVARCCSSFRIAVRPPSRLRAHQKDIEDTEVGVCVMERFVTAVILGSLTLAQGAAAQSKFTSEATTHASTTTATTAANATDFPPTPGGKSTVFGGEIRELDPVRD